MLLFEVPTNFKSQIYTPRKVKMCKVLGFFLRAQPSSEGARTFLWCLGKEVKPWRLGFLKSVYMPHRVKRRKVLRPFFAGATVLGMSTHIFMVPG
jgi:hypothetical protein